MIEEKIVELLSDENIRRILESSSKNGDLVISTDYSSEVTFNHRISDLNAEESKGIIDILNKYGVIKLVDYGNTVACPYCHSINIIERFECPECGSTDLSKGYILQHSKCGKTFSSDTLNIDKCPVCGNPITSRKELKLIGGLFKCNKCGYMFEVPKIVYHCTDCGSEFGIKEANIKKLHKYKLSDEGRKILNTINMIRIISREISENGFKVEVLKKVKGESGVEHIFLMTVILDSDKSIYNIDLTGFFEILEDMYILKNFTKIVDTPNIKHVLIINLDVNKNKPNIPHRDNIYIIYSNNIDDMVTKLINLIKT